MNNGGPFSRRYSRQIPGAVVSIAICLVGIWFTTKVGYSRMLGRYAAVSASTVAAEKAVNVTPLDAQAHRTRADLFYNAGLPAEAAMELEFAVSLRPRDDYLWLQLGMIRDELRQADALPAFDESVRWAPYYAHPKWQRGNYLLRAGRYDEAFADLRTAVSSNQSLVPSLIDLAWGVSRESSERTVQWAGITSDRMRIAFAIFLAQHGKPQESLAQFRSSKVVSLQSRRELMDQLISADAFREAFEIWKGIESEADDGKVTSIHNGSFEGSREFDNTGFGWRFVQTSPGARLSLDPTQAQSGRQSLLVTYSGYSEPASALLTQLLLVEPSHSYRVKFAARAEQIVTGGQPVIVVSEAGGKKSVLGQSVGMGYETTAWQSATFDFKTGDATDAVELRLQRRSCNTAPCPIFGSLWLDSFSIEQLGGK